MGHPLTDALQWHIDNGVDVPIGDTPVNRTLKVSVPQMAENRPSQPARARAGFRRV